MGFCYTRRRMERLNRLNHDDYALKTEGNYRRDIDSDLTWKKSTQLTGNQNLNIIILTIMVKEDMGLEQLK